MEYGSRWVYESLVCVGHVHFMLFLSILLYPIQTRFIGGIRALQFSDHLNIKSLIHFTDWAHNAHSVPFEQSNNAHSMPSLSGVLRPYYTMLWVCVLVTGTENAIPLAFARVLLVFCSH